MAFLHRLLKPRHARRALNSIQSPISSSSSTIRSIQHPSFGNQMRLISTSAAYPKPASETLVLYSLSPAVLSCLIGAVIWESEAHAKDKEAGDQSPPLPQSSPLPSSNDDTLLPQSSPLPSGNGDAEKIAEEMSRRIAELLRSKGMLTGSYPPYNVSTKGPKVSLKFQFSPACDVPYLIANIISHLGLKSEELGAGSAMILQAWDSSIAWQLKLDHPEKQKGTEGGNGREHDDEGDFYVLLFQSLIGPDKAEIEFIKRGSFSPKELDAMVSALQIAGARTGARRPLVRAPRGLPERREVKPEIQVPKPETQVPSVEKSVAALETMGVRVFGLDANCTASSKNDISWENIAGYDPQKREIEDTILLALHSPEIYDDIARGTRCKYESNRPRAVLFEGPPGTGKTSCARVIANQAGVPLLYVPLEIVMSKYYGESERLLGKVFSLANELPNGAIIFLDEVDSFAAARDQGMHEATRRMLSVLLRQIDGFEQDKKVVVIAATNRKGDLDPALISRFDSMIEFGLPDQQNRQEIAAQYAKHLKESELIEFASVTERMSGRDIRDICQQAERHWASKIIRGKASTEDGRLPPIQEYIQSALSRRNALHSLPRKTIHDRTPGKDYGEFL